MSTNEHNNPLLIGYLKQGKGVAFPIRTDMMPKTQ
jgi:hypothetical protein